MGSLDPRVDAYIARSADFAKPVLGIIRETVHAAAPSAEETIKWGMPFFMYNGKILCSMAAFKAHCALHFWKGRQLIDVSESRGEEAMGQFGRIRSVSDLPSKTELSRYVKRATDLHAEATKIPAKKATVKKTAARMPAAFRTALEKNRKVKSSFAGLSPSHRREYVEWIVEARTEPTREKRILQAIEWIGEGKSRNWKYEKR